VHRILIACFALLVVFGASAQKVKFKDIYDPLLVNKQYQQAEPLLKEFVIKRPEPQAFLYLGKIFEDKFMQTDVLLKTARLGQLADTAVYYYELFAKNLTEKEVSKHEEYYEQFKRRDYRSGSFEAKMSYMTEDVRNWVEAIRDRQAKAIKMNRYLGMSIAINSRLSIAYEGMTQPFEGQRQFVLAANRETVDALNSMIRRYDSLVNDAFKNYRSALVQMGNSGYDQKLVIQPIREFGKDGLSKSDFLQNEIAIWDYRGWAEKMISTIQRVQRFKASLLRADNILMEIREKIRKDSIPMTAAVKAVGDSLSNNGILEIDPNPLPYAMFRLKMADILYASIVSEGRSAKNSEDLYIRIAQHRREAAALAQVDSLATSAMSRDLKKEAPEYKDIISETYGSTLNLGSYFRLMRNDASRKKDAIEEQILKLENELKWIRNGEEKIPAMPGAESPGYYPLLFVENNHTVGIRQHAGGVSGYFALTPKSRKNDLLVDFPVDSLGFNPAMAKNLQALSVSARDGAVFYAVIYSSQKIGGKIPVAIAKIFNVKGDELQWARYLKVEGPVEAVSFSQETGLLSLSIYSPDGSRIIQLQKDGTVQN